MVKKEMQVTPNTRLKAQRFRKQWSQVYVATRIGTTDVTVSRWESGTTFPSLYYRQKLCELFGKSAEELGLVSTPEEASQVEGNAADHSSGIWNVPARRNPFFTGREDILEQLHTLLHSDQTAVLTQVQAISGLGGIGKTQTAIEYAYRQRDKYQAVFWVKADTAETLCSDVAALASLLHLPEKEERDQGRIIQAVKRWLQTHPGWLLILDNIEDLPLIEDVVPAEHEGHLVLTTRTQVTGPFAQCIDLEPMAQEEGVLFLLRRAKRIRPTALLEEASPADLISAREIVHMLDGLPLALDQVGAYIEETGCSLSTYLERYQIRQAALLQRRGSLITGHPESVNTTFSLSFERVEQVNPAAAELLRLYAFLAPDAIPEEIIMEAACELGPILKPVVADLLALDEALATLRRYSLLRRNPETKTFTLHRLVQAVLRERMDKETQCVWMERTVRVVQRAFPAGTFETWPRCQRYLPHALACAGLIEQENMLFLEAAQLLTRVGNYLVDRGQHKEVELLLQRALQIQEHLLGPEHLDVAECLHSLGWLYAEQACYREAEPFFQRVLQIREHLLGPEHRDVAESLHRLGDLHFEQGHYKEAEPLWQRALQIREHVLGPGHLDVVDSLDNLGKLYMMQGDYRKAEPLLQRALLLGEQWNPKHPRRGRPLHHIGQLYLKQGRYREAEVFLQRGVMNLEQWVHEQPHTLDDLGQLYWKGGRYREAETFLQPEITWKLGLGVPRPYMAHMHNSLAQLYTHQGKYAEAEGLLQGALMIWEAIDCQHIWAADSLDGMARLYTLEGKYTEAEPLFQRALAVRERWQGKEHPDTLATAEAYADLLMKLKKEEESDPH